MDIAYNKQYEKNRDIFAQILKVIILFGMRRTFHYMETLDIVVKPMMF